MSDKQVFRLVHPTARQMNQFDSRFWQKVAITENEDDCWEWQVSLFKDAYGKFYLDGKMRRAHRVSYEMKHGDAGDQHVLHRCDNRKCVNPKHLFLGTNKDNVDDRVKKGRSVNPTPKHGESNPASKLTNGQVEEIKKLVSMGVLAKGEIARQFGIHRNHLTDILTGRRRKNG